MFDIATDSLHADDGIESHADIAPVIHTASTYQYTKDNQYNEAVYSRCGIPTVTRCEAVLSKILKAPCVTYNSGLSAIFALLTHLNPARIFIERAEHGGYHGTLGVAEVIRKLNKMEVHALDQVEHVELSSKDVIWLETPLNPTGEATDIARYSAMAKRHGTTICVDATFAPPPLQDPFLHGADWVMHSATKYFGGHSDLLAGIVASNNTDAISSMLRDRDFLGTIMSGQTAWLLLRSLRTFSMRVERQAQTALELVNRLNELVKTSSVLVKVTHSSLQTEDYIKRQMQGHSPTFSIYLRNERQAARLPNILKLFHHATSLGGVESLAEWRVMSDKHCNKTLVRLSIGLEDVADLWDDLEAGLAEVKNME